MAAVRKPVLLGLRDLAVQGSPTGPSAWTASKLGGIPDALPAVAAPRPVCERCKEPQTLVVQVYCPLEGSPFHRLLHVFSCARPKCGDSGARSWKVFRSQCLQVHEKEAQIFFQKQENGLVAENWCEGANDWGSDSEEAPPPQLTLDFVHESNSAKDADCTAQLQDLHLQDTVLDATHSEPPAEGMALPTVVPQFLPYYICVVDEDDYRDLVSLDHAHSLLRDYQQREGIGMEQLLSQRYSWSGEPLFLTCPTSEITDIPACSHCGGQRIFEFQLMPALISMLQSANLDLSVEFGTILVYTCEKSCWPQNHQTPMEEFCIIQEDPDELLFK
ncbi:programmed cell death protein 2-like isoform X3 [Marmota monax]|uniref:programmed cell death protein 2-like isoform X4 n=1 Tax=Marmota flaviventris TaxID=93162 RepID=UPI000FFF972D|nr:programmed cell death protein 2-like isoform X2 [Marmota flaviventris]XP_046303866.1 programmed cell death protein 2-like isoform X3 [Marmota monax]